MAAKPVTARSPPPTTIEVPVPGFCTYVGGMGPPQEPLSLAPPRDSTAYIIEKIVWPPINQMTSTTRRILYYHIGFTDLPDVKSMVSCDKALKYISPREIEDWEYKDLERRIEEKERREAEKKAGKRRAGRPAKIRTRETTPIHASRANVTEDTMLLAEQVAGPSLSTPKKRKRQEEEEIATSESEDAAIRRQLGARSASAATGTSGEDESGHENQSVKGVRMANMTVIRRSTSQTLPSLRPPVVPAEVSSHASSIASATKDSSHRSTSRSSAPVAGQPGSTQSLSLAAPRPSVAPPKHKPTPAIPAPAPASSSTTLHPVWATALGMNNQTESPIYPPSNNGHAQHSSSVAPISRTGSFAPQNQPKIHGFTPIPSSNPRPSQGFTSIPATPVERSDSASSEKKSSTIKKSTSKSKGKTPAKSSEKKPAKKKAKVEEATGDDDDDVEDNIWKVKALLDDKYNHTKEGKVHMFLVDWVGDYAPSWEPKENIQDDDLISEYQRRKRAGLLKPDKAQKSMLSYLSKSPFANVNDAFEGDIVDPDKAPTVGTRSDRSHSGDELLVVDQSKAPTSNGKSAARPAPKPASRPPPPVFGSFDMMYEDRFGGPV